MCRVPAAVEECFFFNARQGSQMEIEMQVRPPSLLQLTQHCSSPSPTGGAGRASVVVWLRRCTCQQVAIGLATGGITPSNDARAQGRGAPISSKGEKKEEREKKKKKKKGKKKRAWDRLAL